MHGDQDQVAGDNGELPSTPETEAAVPPADPAPQQDSPAAPIADPVGEDDETEKDA